MVEYIRHDAFIDSPFCRFCEEIQFYWQAIGRRRELSHHKSHIFVNVGALFSVQFNIFSEKSGIGQIASIDGDIPMWSVCPVVFLDFILPFFYIWFQELDFFQFINLFIPQLANTGNLNIDGTFDSPSTGILHAPPLDKRVGNRSEEHTSELQSRENL